ncbi:MAG: glycoside hydrolase family 97 N-terminal domain-containing protein, partial [Bacteroidetes bacterium]|nr:glycoside hydrolase family 97 N-terminal domain-containing protein [Bacteroidota bacterium]
MKKLCLKGLVFICLFLFPLFISAQPQDSLVLKSPNGFLTFIFKLGTEKKPTYEIRYRGQAVIMPSTLGLLKNTQGLDANLDWCTNFSLVTTSRRTVNTSWKPVYGERESIPDHFNELTLTLLDSARLKTQSKGPMQLIVRAYNEGVAFRYFFPGTPEVVSIEIGQEETSFNLPAGTRLYAAYEPQSNYHLMPLTNLQGQYILPLTARHSNGLWSCIMQAEQTQFPLLRLQVEKEKMKGRLQS